MEGASVVDQWFWHGVSVVAQWFLQWSNGFCNGAMVSVMEQWFL